MTKSKDPNIYGQLMFDTFVEVGFGTGMRPNELFSLKWKHVEIQHAKFDKSKEHLQDGNCVIFYVSENTKTGKRTVVSTPGILLTIELLKNQLSKYTEPDDYVFTTWKGGKVRDYAKQFKKMLSELNILEDHYGRIRTPYSLRHSYITWRLLAGKIPIQDIARNCGNSVRQIESHYDHVLNKQKKDVLSGNTYQQLEEFFAEEERIARITAHNNQSLEDITVEIDPNNLSDDEKMFLELIGEEIPEQDNPQPENIVPFSKK